MSLNIQKFIGYLEGCKSFNMGCFLKIEIFQDDYYNL